MTDDSIYTIVDLVEIIVEIQFGIAFADPDHCATIILEDFVIFRFPIALDVQHRQKGPGSMAAGGYKGKGDFAVDPMHDLIAFRSDKNTFGDLQNTVFRNVDINPIVVDPILCPQRQRRNEQRGDTDPARQQP